MNPYASNLTDSIWEVEKLVRWYMSQQNTIIAMCCPPAVDLETQTVRNLAKELDADGYRTVGILTKADRIPEGEEQKWMTTVNNEADKFKLTHGWFAVRNPNQEELNKGVKGIKARDEEQKFFQKEAWKRVKSGCLGSSNLRCFLCELLQQLILKKSCAQSTQCTDETQGQISAA